MANLLQGNKISGDPASLLSVTCALTQVIRNINYSELKIRIKKHLKDLTPSNTRSSSLSYQKQRRPPAPRVATEKPGCNSTANEQKK